MSELISQRLRYRTKIQRQKTATSTYTQPTLAGNSTQGFGLSSSSPSQSIASSQSHDISRISLRPQAKLTDAIQSNLSNDSNKIIQRADDDLPHPQPFPQGSPLSPFNLHLLPGSPLGGGIGYGMPLSPVLPELETDPRALYQPQTPYLGAGGGTDTPSSLPWGLGFQGRYGEDEKSIGAGVGFSF
jgi:hypothetical protein